MTTPDASLSKPPIYRSPRVLIVPVVIVLMCTLPHLDQGDFRKDSGRYAAVGLQMWEGESFLSPALHPDDPYFNKPPLVLWIHGLFLHVLGVSVAASRVPTILAAVGVVLATVSITRKVATRGEAMAVGVALATTVEFFRRTREISLDMWQLLFLMLGCWCVVHAVRRDRPALILGAGAAAGAALLCKPLVGLLGLVIWGVWLWQFGKVRWAWWLGPALVIAVAVAAPWHVYMAQLHGEAFTGQYFGYEVLDRAMGKRATNSPAYYLVELGRGYWPWLAAVLWGLWLMWRKRGRATRGLLTSAPMSKDDQDDKTLVDKPPEAHPRTPSAAALGLSWAAIWFVVLTIFPDKKVHYALVLYPGLSMIAGWALLRLPWRVTALPRLWLREGCPHALKIGVSIAVVVALLPIEFQSGRDPDMVALMRWMHDNDVRPGAVYSHLGHNDDGHFYLHMDAWPMPAKWIEAGRGDGTLAIMTAGRYRRAVSGEADEDGDAMPWAGETVYENEGYVVVRVERSEAAR